MSAVLVATSLDLEHLSATICAEIACGLSDPAGIRAKYNITRPQWDKLKNSPVFREMMAEALREWRGDLNAGKRITKKSEIMLEDSLPVLYEIAHDKESPRQQRLDAVKSMGVFAGKTNSKGDAAVSPGGSRGAVINISIVTKDGEQKGVTIDATSSSVPLLEAHEGELVSD